MTITLRPEPETTGPLRAPASRGLDGHVWTHDRHGGFAPGEAVRAAAALFDPVRYSRARDAASVILGGVRGAWVSISPGVLQVRTGMVADWELTDRDHWRHEREVQRSLDIDLRSIHERTATVGGDRAAIGEWSRKSRANMTRVLATLDWRPLTLAGAGLRPGMVTLTYPGDWQRWAPDGATVKRHLRAFRQAWTRKLGAPIGAWKLEFQRRGAPHFHLYLLCPVGKVDGLPFHKWVSATWARIVGATGEDRARHELAGTGVDFGLASRCSDPQRLAVYFSKHNAPGRSSKEYQHCVPASWSEPGRGPGRFWGYWSLRPCTAHVEVSHDTARDVVRLLRGWSEAQRRTVRREVRRVDRCSGVIGGRTVRRRYRVRALYFGDPAGFVLANDAPSLAAQLARALDAQRPAHPRGTRRPLP